MQLEGLEVIKMRFPIKSVIAIAVLGTVGYFGWQKTSAWLKERRRPEFRMVTVERGDIRITRNATGEVKPVLSVQVGSFVSGPIEDLFVDFNDEVKKGQVLATIDPRIYEAAVARDSATLATRAAEVKRVQAQLQQAVNNEHRADNLRKENEDYISQTEMDQYHFTRTGLEAQLLIAEATVKQAEANLENSAANLAYTKITSPVDGVVINRTIDPGQTLAAQFQAPELFVIAPDMREKMHIFASIDEADIGLIRAARDKNESVIFQVDAYPGEVFKDGKIEQIRLSSTTTQNVVTYPVVVATTNSEMKLLPGMTADLTFQVATHKDVIKIPNAAVRYFPESKDYVHEADHSKLDFSFSLEQKSEDGSRSSLDDKPIDESGEAAKRAATRHVWIQDGEKLKSVEIQIGVSDYEFTEVVGGSLKEGDQIVTGLKPKA